MWSYIKKRLTINREMLNCKLLYLCFGGIVGAYAPYLHVFLCSIGCTTKQSGFLAGFRFLVSSCANPLWGYFADRTGHRKLVLFAMLLGAVVFVVPMPWVAYSLRNTSGNTTVWTNGTSTTTSPTFLSTTPAFTTTKMTGKKTKTTTATATAYTTAATTTTTTTSKPKPAQEPISSTLYSILFTMAIASALFIVPLPGYLDTIGANAARNSVSKASYGGQRIWGSVGSALSNYITGLASDHYHYAGMSPYTPSFFFLLTFLVVTLPVGLRLIDQGSPDTKKQNDTAKEKEEIPPPPPVAPGKLIWKMLKNYEVVFFYATLIVSGLSFNVGIYFSLLLIEKETPSTRANNSFGLVLGSLSNIVFFPLTGKIIKLMRGPTQAMMLSFAVYVVR